VAPLTPCARVLFDAEGTKVAEIKDVFQQHTDVNKLLGAGEFFHISVL
jgi:hypothetical protein